MRKAAVLSFTAIVAVSLTGCGVVDTLRSGAVPDSGAAAVRPAAPAAFPQRLPGSAGGQSPAALDTTTEAERAAALAGGAAGGSAGGAILGRVRVSLGNPADAGFWLQGGIVTTPGKGRVTTASGQSVAVGLRPGSGAAQLSLPAYRALGLALTDLPEVTVTAE